VTRSSTNEVGAPIIEAAGIETIRRRAEGASYLFVINHTDREVDVPAAGVDLLSGAAAPGSVHVAAGGVAVVRETSPVGAG
jgi:beta-galactosidase